MRVLLEDVDLAGSLVNVTVYDVDGTHVLAILFDADADLVTVQQVGSEARTMLAEISSPPRSTLDAARARQRVVVAPPANGRIVFRSSSVKRSCRPRK